MIMMDTIIVAGMMGAIGGMARGVVGLLKALTRKRRIIWYYWFITIAISVFIGIFTGILFDFDLKVSMLAGYAGIDIIEGLLKTFKTEGLFMLQPKRIR